jgi:hypothetical protein
MITHRTRNGSDSTPLEVRIPCGSVTVEGALAIPPGANGVAVFAHGSGSSRHSPRNQFVARVIRESGNGTLLFDLLTAEEEIEDNVTRSLRFDIGLLASRLAEVTRWLVAQPAAVQRWWLRPKSGSGSMPWSRAADDPISRVMRCRVCSRRRCSSWVDTMKR